MVNNKYISLYNKVNMPIIGLGTYKLLGIECINTIKNAYNLGYRLFDTAKMYNNEREIGIALKELNINRNEVFLITKLDSSYKTYDDTIKAIKESLENFNTNYIDLVLLHEPFENDYIVYKALEDLYNQNIIKSIGVSNYSLNELKTLISKVKNKPMVNQVELHPYCQRKNMLKHLKDSDVKVIAYAPFTSLYSNILEDDILKNIAKKYDVSAAQVIINYLSSLGVSIIPKSKDIKHLKENINSFSFNLSNDDIKLIESLDKFHSYYGWNEE